MNLNEKDPLAKFLADVHIVVEASHYEVQSLWRAYRDRLNWEFESKKHIVDLGELADCRLQMRVTLATLNGVKVAFYENLSAVVDYRKVSSWFDRNTPSKADPRSEKGNRYTADAFDYCVKLIVKESGIRLAPAENEYLEEASAHIDDNTELWRLIDRCANAKREGSAPKEVNRGFIGLRRYLIAMLVAAAKSHPAEVIPVGELWRIAMDNVGTRETGDGDTVLDITNAVELHEFLVALLEASAQYKREQS